MWDSSAYEDFCRDFIGLATQYRLADGRVTRRHYLDSAASTLALRCARQVADELLPHYANTHSELHFSARIASHALARDAVVATNDTDFMRFPGVRTHNPLV